MDTDLLRTLVEAVDEGSLSGAARTLGTDLSTVSRRIQALEERVGRELLVRGPRGVRPTPAGGLLAGRARLLLRDLNAAIDSAREGPREVDRFAISAPPQVAESLLPEVLAATLAEHPRAHFEIFATPRRVGLSEEAFDAAVRIGAIAAGHLIAREVGRVRLVGCSRTGAPAAGRIEVKGGPRVESTGLPVVATVATFTEALRLATLGGWLAIAPLYAAHPYIERGELRVCMQLEAPELPMSVVLLRRMRHAAPLATLTEHLRLELARRRGP